MTETPTPPGAPIMQTPELTVLAEYKPVPRPKRIKLAVDADLNDLAVYRKELVGNAKTLEEVHERRKANNAHVTETE